MIKTITASLLIAAVAFLYGEADAAGQHHYPVCSPLAHRVQGSWQAGLITEAEAREVIEVCLDWEDEQEYS